MMLRDGLPVAAGIGLRAPHLRHVEATRPQVPWFEVHSENYFADGGPVLAATIAGAQAADAAFDLGAALHRFIGDGTIIGTIDLP